MSPGPGLLVKSTIEVPTPNGHYKIQLLVGDITALPLQDKVDIIMVSAFPGDYSPTPTSLIGALMRNLNIRVRDLAKNKMEDLRRNFHCWLSHDLPPSLPYRRLLCFEKAFTEISHPAALVGDVFRALVPTFKNDESTVITPILASGDQNFDMKTMLKAMVNAAGHWMQAGLPLECLKIVIYSPNPQNAKTDPTLLQQFEKLKKKWEASKSALKDISEIKYDVYLSYSIQDMGYVKKIEEQLKKQKDDIRIFSEKQQLNLESAWQENIYQVMVTCVRVVTILSPHYLESSECLEQYNIALCCNRLTKRDILAPFYVVQVPQLPTYMQLMQYICFRTRTIVVDGVTREEKFEEKLKGSCKKFIKLLTHDQALEHRVSDTFVAYDVFISYAHKNVKKAENFLNLLTRLNPHLKIFFDTKELRTGSSWQQSLYSAMDGSKVVIALLSSHYLSSQVCGEEYNLALIQHMTQRTEIIPVLIEEVDKMPRSFTFVPIISGVEKFDNVANKVCQSIDAYFQFKKKLEVFSPAEEIVDVDEILEQHRQEFFGKHFKITHNKIEKTKPTCPQRIKLPSKSMEECINDPLDLNVGHDVVFSFVQSDKKFAQFMSRYLLRRNPDLNISIESESEQKKMIELDAARLVVALISPQYLRSPQGRDEFHVSLCKHRVTKGKSVLYSVQVSGLLPKPSFPLLIPCNVSCNDYFWKTIQFCGEMGTNSHPSLPKSQALWEVIKDSTFSGATMWTQDMMAAGDEINLQLKHALALTVACEDILDVLNAESTGYSRNEIITNIMNLKNGYLTDDVVPFEPSFLKEITVPDLLPPEEEEDNAEPLIETLDTPPEHTPHQEQPMIKTRVGSSIPDLKESLVEPRNESERMSKAGDLMSEASTLTTEKPSETSVLSSTDSDEVSFATSNTQGSSKFKIEGDLITVTHLHYEPSGKTEEAPKETLKTDAEDRKNYVESPKLDARSSGKVTDGREFPTGSRASTATSRNSAMSRETVSSHGRSQSCSVL
ncbi:uncharacterized protein LOC135488421 isoform X2 [Lineus longissimus]|uniref:uncharacterized protein LOC135488421 isoform X2 n=1 Tax=Lineus longissimus TaxID=88925 RepID=UPI002B4CC2EA